jgi:ornithine cyclodeaminase
VVAKYMAASKIKAVGIVGTGTQARMQLQYLRSIIDFPKVYVWGRSDEAIQKYIVDMQEYGFNNIHSTKDMRELGDNCNYIVTTTPSDKPLIMAKDVRIGTHITAMGADTPGKQELDPAILEKADIIVVDSKSQCYDHGETSYAIQQKLISPDKSVELGSLIKDGARRENDTQITVADLTGVAVQDIQIASQIYNTLKA